MQTKLLNVWIHDLANITLALSLKDGQEPLQEELVRIIDQMKEEAEK